MRLGRSMSLLIGGARSGKSDLAVRLGRAWPGQVTFVATATAGDADMQRRIDNHQAERPASWALVESPQFSADDARSLPPDDLVIVDCITLLVSNLTFGGQDGTAHGPTEQGAAVHGEADIDHHVAMLGEALASRSTPTIVISNEVGLGIHPATELGRTYRDTLGRANRLLATTAETSLFVVAGRVLPLHDLTITW